MKVTNHIFHASAARTATGNGSAVDVTSDKAVMYIDVSAASGTSPTLDAKIQGYDPLSASWFDTGDAFAQLTTTGSERVEIAALPDARLRVAYTIGGTTPSFTFTVGMTTKESM